MKGQRLRNWIFALGIAMATSEARAEAPACIAEVDVVPARPVVGQQVSYRVRIFRREDVPKVHWVHRPAFPHLRVEWLPGRAEDSEVSRYRSRYLVSEEHRALFPARPGPVRLPSFELECGGTRVSVPRATLDVREPPTRGRPSDFRGVIGPVQVQVAPERRTIRLGEAVEISVLVRGTSALWDIEPPFRKLQTHDRYAIFPRRPELDIETGQQVYLRRYFRFDFVPHEVGTLEIPAVEIPYYDPETQHFGRAASSRVVVEVAPRASTVPARNPTTPTTEIPESRPTMATLVAAGLLGAAALAGGTAWRRGRHRRNRRARLARALDDARLARERQDDVARAAALLRALEIVSGGPGSKITDELTPLRVRLEVVRFGGSGDPAADSAWRDAEAAISRLR